jgi:hypothetical protein
MPEDFNKQFRGMVWDSAKKVAKDTAREAPGDFVRDMKKAGSAIGRGAVKVAKVAFAPSPVANAAAKGIRKLGGNVNERLFNMMK